MGDPSIIFVCLVFCLYPWFHAPVLLFVLGFALAGAAVQFFLLRRTGRARWFPLLGAGIMAALEVLYQLNQFDVINTIHGHDIFNYVGFGVVVLYVLFGTLIGWLVHLGCSKIKSRGGEGWAP